MAIYGIVTALRLIGLYGLNLNTLTQVGSFMKRFLKSLRSGSVNRQNIEGIFFIFWKHGNGHLLTLRTTKLASSFSTTKKIRCKRWVIVLS